MTGRRRFAVRVRRSPPVAQSAPHTDHSEPTVTTILTGDSGRPVILATVTPGLEATCASEIIARVPEATEVATGRGKVWVSLPDVDRRLATVRTADNLFLHLGEVESGPIRRDLPDLAKVVSSLPALEPILGGRPEIGRAHV